MDKKKPMSKPWENNEPFIKFVKEYETQMFLHHKFYSITQDRHICWYIEEFVDSLLMTVDTSMCLCPTSERCLRRQSYIRTMKSVVKAFGKYGISCKKSPRLLTTTSQRKVRTS